MPLAELEVFHSRLIAPTRRVALGRSHLPVDGSTGLGGVLLGGIVARFLPEVDVDFHSDFLRLLRQLQRGERIPQPRLRHRFQEDRVGLARSTHRLARRGGALTFTFQTSRGAPEQFVLAAAYAAGAMAYTDRPLVMDMMRKAERWQGPADATLIAHLAGRLGDLGPAAAGDPVGWAMGTFGFESRPEAAMVQRRFRDLVRAAHPDTADGADADAGERISDFARARRILLESAKTAQPSADRRHQ